jgi:hypothetical protein
MRHDDRFTGFGNSGEGVTDFPIGDRSSKPAQILISSARVGALCASLSLIQKNALLGSLELTRKPSLDTWGFPVSR